MIECIFYYWINCIQAWKFCISLMGSFNMVNHWEIYRVYFKVYSNNVKNIIKTFWVWRHKYLFIYIGLCLTHCIPCFNSEFLTFILGGGTVAPSITYEDNALLVDGMLRNEIVVVHWRFYFTLQQYTNSLPESVPLKNVR